MSPCPSARHAIEVRRAAGLSDTISASDALSNGAGADVLAGGPLALSSFGAAGGGFGGNSSYGEGGTPALATAGASALSSSNVNAGAYAPAPSQPVGLLKSSTAADD
jgi:hypothetical protein